jgi:hypothetical protein
MNPTTSGFTIEREPTRAELAPLSRELTTDELERVTGGGRRRGGGGGGTLSGGILGTVGSILGGLV